MIGTGINLRDWFRRRQNAPQNVQTNLPLLILIKFVIFLQFIPFFLLLPYTIYKESSDREGSLVLKELRSRTIFIQISPGNINFDQH